MRADRIEFFRNRRQPRLFPSGSRREISLEETKAPCDKRIHVALAQLSLLCACEVSRSVLDGVRRPRLFGDQRIQSGTRTTDGADEWSLAGECRCLTT